MKEFDPREWAISREAELRENIRELRIMEQHYKAEAEKAEKLLATVSIVLKHTATP